TALPALNAQVGFPHRYEVTDVALLKRRGTRRKRAVDGHQAYRDLVPQSRHHCCREFLDEFWRAGRDEQRAVERTRHARGHLHFEEIGQRSVDGGEVELHHLFAFL